MNSVFLKQYKPAKVKILGIIILVFVAYLLIGNNVLLSQILILSFITILLIGYSVLYKIDKEFENYKLIRFLGITIWKQKITIEYPDYISVFSISFTQDNNWGTISSLGSQIKQNATVARFFSGSRYTTLYKSENYQSALDKANELSQLLNVEVYDATKE